MLADDLLGAVYWAGELLLGRRGGGGGGGRGEGEGCRGELELEFAFQELDRVGEDAGVRETRKLNQRD